MLPEPSALLPVTPWIIVPVPLGNAAKFSLTVHFQNLYFSRFIFYYIIHGPDFYSHFLRYITFNALENYILITFPYLLYENAISSTQV